MCYNDIMIRTIEDNFNKTYRIQFIENPENFATILSYDDLRSYGVENNEFWKKFIVNINDEKQDVLASNGLYEHLAKIYFVTKQNKKIYLMEKLLDCGVHNQQTIQKIADELKKQKIIVDVSSAVLVDGKEGYKFLKYRIEKE